MPHTSHPQIAACLALTRAICASRTIDDIYEAALAALDRALAVRRSAILLFDEDEVMRFKAHRGLSAEYCRGVEGHSPWPAHAPDAQPVVVEDVTQVESLAPILPLIRAEGIAAMCFVPLVSRQGVIGKFMLYFDAPHAPTRGDLEIAELLAAQIAFAVERARTEDQARRSEERLRFALDAALMGTWDWDITRNTVKWSENLERIHGLPAGTFDGTFASYEREIHPDDRERVLASARRAIGEGVPHDVEYRIVAPDGTVRWVEGKGRVEYGPDGRPARMSGVCMMVSRRKEAELARLAAVEEASRHKDEFLATLSHELRTPLNAIVGWVQLLQHQGLPPERIRQGLEVIGRNAALQGQLIEDILDVSRIITGKLSIEREPLLIQQVIEPAVAGLAPAARAKGVALTTSLDAALPLVEGDRRRLAQVLGNVLGNALKFTPEGGSIRVTCTRTADGVGVSVADTGCGIEPGFLPFVFERFRQGDSTSTRRHGGLGLGLALARHIVELHGGTIRAISQGSGTGTTVTFDIPALAGDDGVDAGSGPAAVVEQDVRLDGLAVLVVDDQPDSRELVAEVLGARGAAVVQSAGAEAALALLQRSTADVLIADIAMPDIDGYALLQAARALRPGLPSVAVTAYARPEDRQRALAAGFDAYCAKPVNTRELIDAVRRVSRPTRAMERPR